MAKTTAPLLSFDAAGTIAKTQVYSRWKGRPYVRRYQIPANPNSSEQQLTRNSFRWLQAVYKIAPALVTAPWDLYARGLVMTGRNAFTKANNSTLRTASDLSVFTMSPGALGGLAPTAVVATPGSGQLSIAITAPSVVPTGWTIYSGVAAVIKDQDPQSDVDYTITAGEDLTSTYAVVLTGLDAVLYQVFGWFKWNRPDGSFAYSPSVQTSGTPS
jgi:hypothetical protein